MRWLYESLTNESIVLTIIIATLIVRVRHVGTPRELGVPYAREEK